MGDYEKEQSRLQAIWDEIMSDEDNESEFADVYLSEEYKPESSNEYSSDSCEEPVPKKRVKKNDEKSDEGTSNMVSATMDLESGSHETISIQGTRTVEQQTNIIDVTIQEVIDMATITEEVCHSEQFQWREVDGTSLKTFDYSVENDGIKSSYYENYIDQEPCDCFKIFLTDDIINYIVEQTNLYAQQVLQNYTTPSNKRKHKKKWVPTNTSEMEKFFGIIMWMGLVKYPRIKAY
ncbi:uncharacterized protein [Diabrotica undecimpunctata]|uniref:uncharacterized protein n=1 Tax=Diabrotica undecimpunctata TaxID=50387 RepID=UPI003B63FD9A